MQHAIYICCIYIYICVCVCVCVCVCMHRDRSTVITPQRTGGKRGVCVCGGGREAVCVCQNWETKSSFFYFNRAMYIGLWCGLP